MVQLLRHFADKGYPMQTVDLVLAAEYLVSFMPEERRNNLPFKDGISGRGFL